MPTVQRFEDLRIWQEARQLVRDIYRLTKSGQIEKDYGLKTQLQRAAVSVVSNIAEGFERGSNKEFNQYLYQSKASCGEVRSQFYLAYDLEYIQKENLDGFVFQTEKLAGEICAFIKYLKKSPLKGKKFSIPKL
jgi:four helix bundle protein